MHRRRLLGKAVPGHYTIKIDGNTYIYCNIRKNASTAFKRFFLGESRYASKYDGERALGFMGKYHATVRLDFKKRDAMSLVVIRDPVARLISLYLNKFVVRDGNQDIFQNYHRMTGKDPNDATFLDFLRNYISPYDFNEIDCHAIPQVNHMQPVVYIAPIRFEYLYNDIRLALGETLAKRYFMRKANKTTYAKETEAGEDYRASPQDLIAHYQRTGALPNSASFYCDDLVEIVNTKYRADMLVFEKLNQDYQSLGGKSLPKLETHLML